MTMIAGLLLGIFFLVLLVVALLYFKFSYFPFQVLKRNGIDGPPPSFFFGNYQSLAKLGLAEFIKDLHKNYGPIVGFYWGIRPYIAVTDIELIKRVTIKDFDVFMNRPKNRDIVRNRPGKTKGMFLDRDDVWRVGRQTLSPTFSSAKMRAMAPIIQNSVKTLVEIFREQADAKMSFEVFRTYSSFTMETLFATAFGRVMDIQRNRSDPLVEATAAIFSSITGKKHNMARATMILNNFPWITPIVQYMEKGSKPLKSFQLLAETAIDLIKKRRDEAEPEKYKDLLQLMMDATVEDDGNVTSKRLTDEEITAHAVLFMLVGYETTANSLAYTSYVLALHPHIQEKLQEEIDSYFEEHPDSSLYQAAQDLRYLDMVLQESLRLYPPGPIFTRECGKDYTYKDITIPKGTALYFSSLVLQKDPEYWDDPEKFDPLRFTPEEKAKRPQQCYLPFGAGKRSCIGMRFATLQAKIALIELVKEFTFIRAPDTEVPLELVVGITMAPKNGIYLKVANRKIK